ncbi:MAG: hypothetical protein MUW56_16915 [Chryseobacterium sp.]|nr:hypothetical protein [Chryseobacterium sp.]MCJ7935252.1 hypothetical protein [Chryseobacterium sp.]
MIGGGACFLIGGISNLSKANAAEVKNGETKGSPVPLISLLGAAGGVVLK